MPRKELQLIIEKITQVLLTKETGKKISNTKGYIMKKTMIKTIICCFVLLFNFGCKGDSSDGVQGLIQTEEIVISSIEILPTNRIFIVDQTYQLQAIAHFTNESTLEVTENATWESSDSSIAGIENTSGNEGLLACLTLGTVTINATYEGIQGSTVITVAEEEQIPLGENIKIIFLHHSTGQCIWSGGVPGWFSEYNAEHECNYEISEQDFPRSSPYGWKNYPYDYWNIWVNHAGDQTYIEEPTLEILTQEYDVIVWKHCFPVSSILPDTGSSDIGSESKRIENYKLQYDALKTKMKEFPGARFIVWTGAALVENATTEEQAQRSRMFFDWVKTQWDDPGDNIYIWDFFELETDGGIYLKNEYAASSSDSHPNATFSQTVAPYFCQRIVDVVEGRGDTASLTGY